MPAEDPFYLIHVMAAKVSQAEGTTNEFASLWDLCLRADLGDVWGPTLGGPSRGGSKKCARSPEGGHKEFGRNCPPGLGNESRRNRLHLTSRSRILASRGAGGAELRPSPSLVEPFPAEFWATSPADLGPICRTKLLIDPQYTFSRIGPQVGMAHELATPGLTEAEFGRASGSTGGAKWRSPETAMESACPEVPRPGWVVERCLMFHGRLVNQSGPPLRVHACPGHMPRVRAPSLDGPSLALKVALKTHNGIRTMGEQMSEPQV